jgi:capsular exopolysaccharide synthesis family protein
VSSHPHERREPVVAKPPAIVPPADWEDKPPNSAYERLVHHLVGYRRSFGRNSLVVSSAVRGEGASSVARNLCRKLVQSTHDQVLLIDGNLRHPTQHLAFGVDASPGLTDLLQEGLPLDGVVRGVGDTGLSVVTSGCHVDNPAHVLARPAVTRALTSSESDFDWVVIDAPAFTVYPDGALLAGVTGGAVLVLQAESTRLEVAEEAKRVLEGTGAHVVGAVLNRRRYHIPDLIYRRL